MNQNLISQNNTHLFISGQTRSGKTFFSARALRQLKDPVLFLNIQDENLPGFMKLESDDIDFKQLLEVLKKGEKVDLRFPGNYTLKIINKITGYLLTEIMAAGFTEKRPIYIVLDECHTLQASGLDAAIQLATRGLSRGVRGVFITQRPALVNKTIYTQSNEHYLFYLSPSEKQYFNNKGFNFEYCQKIWEDYGLYSYVYFDGKDMHGRRPING